MISLQTPNPNTVLPSQRVTEPYNRPEPQKIKQMRKPSPFAHPSQPHKQSQHVLSPPIQAKNPLNRYQNNSIMTPRQQSHPQNRADNLISIAGIQQKSMKDSKILKKYTIGSELPLSGILKPKSTEGNNTARSIPNDRSLTKLNSNYLEISLREEEQMLKKQEEMAWIFKEKQKKMKQIIKEFRKAKQGILSQHNPASLSAIAPQKPKPPRHKRGQSCNLPVQNHEDKTSHLDNLQQVNSQQQSESVRKKHSDTEHSTEEILHLKNEIEDLKKEVDQWKEKSNRKQKQCQKMQKQISQISQSLDKQAFLNKTIQDAAKIKEDKNKLKLQLQQAQKIYQQKLLLKESQIAHLNAQISQKTIKLHNYQAKYNQQIKESQRQRESKDQQYQQSKRRAQKELADLSAQRKKAEQEYLKEIEFLKKKIEGYKNQQNSKDHQRQDEIAQKEQTINSLKEEIKKIYLELVKSQQLMQIQIKKKQQLEKSCQILKEEVDKQTKIVSKLTIINEEKQQANQSLKLYLANAEDHIRKVEEKYHAAHRDLTEKNVSYDFLWIQLKQEEQKSKILQERFKRQETSQGSYQEPHTSLLHSENDSPVKQEGQKGLTRILSSSTMKDIKDLHGMMQEGQSKPKLSPSEKEVRLPLSHRLSLDLPLPLLADSKCQEEPEVQLQAPLQEVQKSNSNIIFKNELSEAFSEENDEIFDMVSKQNSNGSKLESSLGAFSEYSRAKSTQSALTHKQVEQEYQSRLKNSKMMAKLGKFKNKK